MGSLVSAPRLPDAWANTSSPFLLTATKTKPGILSVEDVASSIAGFVSICDDVVCEES